jgi:hypothetical protein
MSGGGGFSNSAGALDDKRAKNLQGFRNRGVNDAFFVCLHGVAGFFAKPVLCFTNCDVKILRIA